MSANSEISWTTHTWNPWWGCVKVSEACRNCYAATLAHRYGTEWGPSARRRFFGEVHWQEPLKWNRKAEGAAERPRVFCASMADVFEILPKGHPDAEQIDQARKTLWHLIQDTPNLDWLLLTKRPENIERLAHPFTGQHCCWPDNVWVGCTAENQEWADKRIPHLLRVKARVRFISAEPLLGPLDLTRIAFHDNGKPESDPEYRCQWLDALNGVSYVGDQNGDADAEWEKLYWVIAGGESGQGARPSHPAWFRSLRDQCQATGTAFHFKQYGNWHPSSIESADVWVGPDGELGNYCSPSSFVPMAREKDKNFRLLDLRIWDEVPR